MFFPSTNSDQVSRLSMGFLASCMVTSFQSWHCGMWSRCRRRRRLLWTKRARVGQGCGRAKPWSSIETSPNLVGQVGSQARVKEVGGTQDTSQALRAPSLTGCQLSPGSCVCPVSTLNLPSKLAASHPFSLLFLFSWNCKLLCRLWCIPCIPGLSQDICGHLSIPREVLSATRMEAG